MPNANTVQYTAEEEYPDFSKHNNILAKCLTLERYKALRAVQTPNGFTIDNAIQTGVCNPGKKSWDKKVANVKIIFWRVQI